jgi:hypothetical protein
MRIKSAVQTWTSVTLLLFSPAIVLTWINQPVDEPECIFAKQSAEQVDQTHNSTGGRETLSSKSRHRAAGGPTDGVRRV